MEIIILSGVYAPQGSRIQIQMKDGNKVSGLFIDKQYIGKYVVLWRDEDKEVIYVEEEKMAKIEVLEEIPQLSLEKIPTWKVEEDLVGKQIYGFKEVEGEVIICCSKDGEFSFPHFEGRHDVIQVRGTYYFPTHPAIRICIGKDQKENKWVFVSEEDDTLSKYSDQEIKLFMYIKRIEPANRNEHYWKIVDPKEYTGISVVHERFFSNKIILFGHKNGTEEYVVKQVKPNYVHPQCLGGAWRDGKKIYVHLGDHRFLDLDTQEITTTCDLSQMEYIVNRGIDVDDVKQRIYQKWARRYPRLIEELLQTIRNKRTQFFAVFDHPDHLRIVAKLDGEPTILVLNKNNLDDCI